MCRLHIKVEGVRFIRVKSGLRHNEGQHVRVDDRVWKHQRAIKLRLGRESRRLVERIINILSLAALTLPLFSPLTFRASYFLSKAWTIDSATNVLRDGLKYFVGVWADIPAGIVSAYG